MLIVGLLAGYKPTAAKSVDEYAQMDAEDESLARWKASLGIAPGAAIAPAAGPKVRAIILLLLVKSLPALQVTVLTLELDSPTLPPGKKLILDLQDPSQLTNVKKNPINIKEGVEYK